MDGATMIAEDRKGFLVPPWFVREDITDNDMNLGSLLFGFTLSVTVFASAQAGGQSVASWKRSKRVSRYIAMLWLELVASLALGVLTWVYLRGVVRASFWVFFFVVFFWSLEIQFLLQIIVNRLGLMILSPDRTIKMKWATAIIITIINISVFCIWVPARLQINHTYILINEAWDRTEKGIFAITDFSLNMYFVYLVRSQLVTNGLVKYARIYKMNIAMVCISISLDIVLIGLMSLKNTMIYLQFHPVAYLLKLVIEMNMADLIVKVVRAANPLSHPTPRTDSRHTNRTSINFSPFQNRLSRNPDGPFGQQHNVHGNARQDQDMDRAGIQQTMENSLLIRNGSQDDNYSVTVRRSSSLRNMKEPITLPNPPHFQVP
ncbi:hypothetical protein F4779DRAFT_602113 [Xylariaceae sp. FL0662B]|nr:hypothetical protein F4779DRAFT_602113 [Xylariaceae sp. FL0662B]